MKKGEKMNPQELSRVRRMRKARRLCRYVPLFAYDMLSAEHPGYSYEEFLDDLRRRTPKKKKKPKNTLIRYGRYRRMEKLLSQYRLTGDIAYARQANNLRKRMSKPYEVLIKIEGSYKEFTFSPLISIDSIEALVKALNQCKTKPEAEQLVSKFIEANSYGK